MPGAGRRLTELQAQGVRGLYISADAFHLALYPVHRYLCCYEVAVEVFGPEKRRRARV